MNAHGFDKLKGEWKKAPASCLEPLKTFLYVRKEKAELKRRGEGKSPAHLKKTSPLNLLDRVRYL